MLISQSSVASPTNNFEVTTTKVILGLVLFSLAIVFSRTTRDGTKLQYSPSSRPLNEVPANAISIQQHFDEPVKELVASLKTATMAAAPRPGQGDLSTKTNKVEFNSEEAELQWIAKNPCISRSELKLRYERRKSVKNVDILLELQAVMDEYTKLHRACIQASGDLTNLFLTQSSESGCKFLVAEAGNGLGNRIMWMVSNLMYAILTQRVLLVDPRSTIPSLMCEPFLGSSWAAPKDFPFADQRPDLWQTTNEFIANINSMKAHEEKNGTIMVINAARADDSWGPISRFFCPTEQSIYDRVRWITLGGCLYFLPELFAIPKFQPILESLFKDKKPLTHLLRYSMLPVDLIWARVSRVEEVYLKNKKQMVGVHVRYRGGYEDYKNHHDLVNRNVKDCLEQNSIIPKTSNSSNWKLFTPAPKPSPGGILVLFISSLYDSLFDDFKVLYPQDVALSKVAHMSREIVSLVHLSSEGQQSPGLEIDSEALVEILCLSFSDALLTSPMSTFSQVAQAYGGLKPWIINLQDQDGQSQRYTPSCRRGKSTDGCYQGAGVFHVCPNDPEVDNSQIMKQVTSLKPCEDGSQGVQFVPD